MIRHVRLLPTCPNSSSSWLSETDEAPLQLAAVQLSHCMWGLHTWGPRGSDPTAGEVTAADPVPSATGPPLLLIAALAARASGFTTTAVSLAWFISQALF